MYFLFEFRFWVITLAITQPFFCSGLIYGWGGLILILKGENYYSFKCDLSNPSTIVSENGIIECIELDSYLNFISTLVISIQTTFALFGGILIDYLGPKSLIIVQTFVFIGTILMALIKPDINQSIDIFLIGIVLQNIFGLIMAPSLIHYAFLYPKAFYFLCLTMSAAVGFSSLVYPILHSIWKFTSFSFSSIMFFYSFIIFLYFGFTIIQPSSKLLMGSKIYFNWKKFSIYINTFQNKKNFHDQNIEKKLLNHTEFFISDNYLSKEESSIETGKVEDENVRTISFHQDLDIENYEDKYIKMINKEEKFLDTSKNHYIITLVSLLKQDLNSIIRAPFFLIYLLFTMFWTYVFLFYLTSINSQLFQMTLSIDVTTKFTEIFSWITPLGFIGSLFTAFVLYHWSYRWALFCIILMGLTHIVCNISQIISIQIISFFLYTFAQESLWGILYSFIAQFFRNELLVTVIGIITTLEGLLMFTINPLVKFILLNNYSFHTVNLVLLVLGTITLSIPFLFNWSPNIISKHLNFSSKN